jgi:tRNA(Ile)-lysidine synthase
MQAENHWIDNLIQADFENCIRSLEPHAVALDLTGTVEMDTAAKRRLIRKAIQAVKGNLRRVTLQHVDAVLHLADEGSARRRVDLPDRIHISKSGAVLWINRISADRRPSRVGTHGSDEGDYSYTLDAPGVFSIEEAGATIILTEIRTAELPDYAEIGRDQAFLDMDRLEFPLTVRNMRAGDRFSPLGVDGTQKVKKFFVDHKIYGHQRRMCPLLICRGTIVWIAGYRIDNSVKIVPETRRVLKAELLLA